MGTELAWHVAMLPPGHHDPHKLPSRGPSALSTFVLATMGFTVRQALRLLSPRAPDLRGKHTLTKSQTTSHHSRTWNRHGCARDRHLSRTRPVRAVPALGSSHAWLSSHGLDGCLRSVCVPYSRGLSSKPGVMPSWASIPQSPAPRITSQHCARMSHSDSTDRLDGVSVTRRANTGSPGGIPMTTLLECLGQEPEPVLPERIQCLRQGAGSFGRPSTRLKMPSLFSTRQPREYLPVTTSLCIFV